MVRARTISPEALTALQGSTWPEPDLMVLPASLPRKVYLECADVASALGGEWNRKRKGTVFPTTGAADALDMLVATGQYASPGDARKAFQFYETPEAFANELVIRHLRPYLPEKPRVLEPSAGSGRLVAALKRNIVGVEVTAVEVQAKFHGALSLLAQHVHTGTDFLSYSTLPTSAHSIPGGYDGVLMNPPFTRQQDAHHILQALAFLRPGGRLVAIASAAVKFRQTMWYDRLRTIIENYRGKVIDNPEGTFASEGTLVNTVTIVLERRDDG
ncbi:MAG: methyltransferase [Planctomycetes bacterium]|nr:methyltransferase [Planctomycetota bacterium]